MEILFSGGVPIISWWFGVVAIDLVSGYWKALKHHKWKSAINIDGLMKKLGILTTIIVASALDHVAPIVGVHIPINLGLIWTALMFLAECGSVLENASELGINVDFLMKYLDVFHKEVDSNLENKEEK